ncbi:hypothetical protein PVK06_043000 [Gossypium arboreum]|uniref:Flavodoxin-like domain-containing protein n=1 Tax=Gossypium arboreum TaxID=29729 RepID=A0ABR0MMA0_GOSAR|nr:hypothetical protein PVK06_043000 [Gossypium arboreum]
MGKGGGCVPSKKKHPTSAEDGAGTSNNTAPIAADEETHATPTVTESSENAQSVAAALEVFIVFYSMYGHVEKLAKRMKKGVEGVEGVKAVLYRVPETLPDEVLEHMKAPPKALRFRRLRRRNWQWRMLFCLGSRQVYEIVDSADVTWTAITQLAHHRMLFVPIGYTFGDDMSKIDFIHGGSPYGAGFYAGDGTREPIEIELAVAEHQGKYMAGVANRLSQG